ncbi:MAG: chloride channel protein [Gammaproteobacteria bacterium]|nr:MAG: chloride channel protein [Gammaproteobacteria bacterium]
MNASGREINAVAFSLVSLLVGVATGYGAVAFRWLIGWIHNAAFLGQFSADYDANLFTPASPWGPFVILVPVVGALLVTYLVRNYAPEARGHGVPEVMDAVYYRAGVIRPVVVIVKSLASAISIGTGASVGREGPIVQIGSAIASTAGGWLRLAPWQRITLVAAGAGGGIAATFNTPLGAVLFAVELILPEVSVRTFMPVAIATGMSTVLGRRYLGDQPAFSLPDNLPVLDISFLALGEFALFGALIGLAATLYVRGIYWSEDQFAERIRNDYLRHVVGMAIVGLMFYSFLRTAGHYHVEGVGYATVQAIINGELAGGLFLFLLFAAKLVATSVTLGAGASGGVFSPALFLGATLGGAFGTAIDLLAPGAASSVPSFAMLGMAAMVGSATGAAMTAIVMIFEMTRDYDLVMPMIVAVAVAQGVRRTLSTDNIYTLKLTRRGHYIPTTLHSHMFMVRRAEDVMNRDLVRLDGQVPLRDFARQLPSLPQFANVLLCSGDRIAGLLEVDATLRSLPQLDPELRLAQLGHRDFTIVRKGMVMFDVIKRMNQRNVAVALVVGERQRVPRAADVEGVITRNELAEAVSESLSFRASAADAGSRPAGQAD